MKKKGAEAPSNLMVSTRQDDLTLLALGVQDVDSAILLVAEGSRNPLPDHAENRLPFLVRDLARSGWIRAQHDLTRRQFDVEPCADAETVLGQLIFMRHPDQTTAALRI